MYYEQVFIKISIAFSLLNDAKTIERFTEIDRDDRLKSQIRRPSEYRLKKEDLL